MQKVRSIIRNTYKKNLKLLKWLFTIAVVLGIVVLPVLQILIA